MCSDILEVAGKYGKWQESMGGGKELWEVAGKYVRWRIIMGSGRETWELAVTCTGP